MKQTRDQFCPRSRCLYSSCTAPESPFTGPEHGRYLAERVPGAKYVELSGVDHLFFAEDMDPLLSEIQEFLTGVPEAREPDRVLATVMFVDIVSSTEQATRLGDRQWHDVLDRYYAIARRQLARFRGREIDTAGDGRVALTSARAAPAL